MTQNIKKSRGSIGRLPIDTLREIKDILSVAKVSKSAVARDAGVSLNTVRNFLNGDYYNREVHASCLSLSKEIHQGKKVTAQNFINEIERVSKIKVL